jgi:hypothetical protein
MSNFRKILFFACIDKKNIPEVYKSRGKKYLAISCIKTLKKIWKGYLTE